MGGQIIHVFFHQVQCNTLFDSPSRSKPCFHHIAFNSFHVAWRVENNIYPAEFNYVRRHPERSYSHKSCTNSHTGLQLQMELQEQEWLMVIALQCLVKVYEVWHMWDHLRHVLVFVCFFFSLMNICLCSSSPFLLPNFPVQSNASVPGWLNSSSTRWKEKLSSILRYSWRCWQKTAWNAVASRMEDGKEPSVCGIWQESCKMSMQVWGAETFL